MRQKSNGTLLCPSPRTRHSTVAQTRFQSDTLMAGYAPTSVIPIGYCTCIIQRVVPQPSLGASRPDPSHRKPMTYDWGCPGTQHRDIQSLVSVRRAPPLVAASSQFPAFVSAVRASRRRILEIKNMVRTMWIIGQRAFPWRKKISYF